jgi:hypothetical protein
MSSSLRSMNALFRRAVETPSLAEFAAYMSTKTSGGLFRTGREVVFHRTDIADEANYSAYTFTSLNGQFSARSLLGALSRRLEIIAAVREEGGSQILTVQLIRRQRETTRSVVDVDLSRTFATVRFTYHHPHSKDIKLPLFEEIVRDMFVDEFSMVGYSLDYSHPMCYYVAGNPTFGRFVEFCRDVVAEKIMEVGDTKGVENVVKALAVYFDEDVATPDMVTFRDVRDMFVVVDTPEEYNALCNSFRLAVDLMSSKHTAAYFEFINTAKETRDTFSEKFPMELLTDAQNQILTKTFTENVLSGTWSSVVEFRAALKDTEKLIRSKITFTQLSNSDFSLLDQFEFLESVPGHSRSSVRHDDAGKPMFEELTYVGEGGNVQVTLLNEHGVKFLRADDKAPKNVRIRVRNPGLNTDVRAWMCADWDQETSLGDLEFVQLIDMDTEPLRPHIKTCNVFVEKTSADLVEKWYCWLSGSFAVHTFRRLLKITTKQNNSQSTKELTTRDSQGFLHSFRDAMPARTLITLRYSASKREMAESERRIEFWSHGQLHREGKAAVQWFSGPEETRAQVWRRGMAFASSPLFKTGIPGFAHPVIQAGGSCYIAAVFNLLFNSPVLKNALISSINKDIALDPSLLKKLQGPLVTHDNNFLITQAAFQTLCSDTVRSPQATTAITAAFSERLCKFGGNSFIEIQKIFEDHMQMDFSTDFSLKYRNQDNGPRGRHNLFHDAASFDTYNPDVPLSSIFVLSPEYYVLIGVFLTYEVADSSEYHVITGLNFANKSSNFIFDSNGAEHHYDWVNQPSTCILDPEDSFSSVVYVLVSRAFYDANIVKTEENRCGYKFSASTLRK